MDKDGKYLNDYDLKSIQQKQGGELAEQLDTFNVNDENLEVN